MSTADRLAAEDYLSSAVKSLTAAYAVISDLQRHAELGPEAAPLLDAARDAWLSSAELCETLRGQVGGDGGSVHHATRERPEDG